MLERQREGIAKAKADGKYKGRKPTVAVQIETIRAMYATGVKPATSPVSWESHAAACIGCWRWPSLCRPRN